MKVLQDVDISDLYYACALYALRRVGANLSVTELRDIRGVNFSDETELEEGDILVWDVDDPHVVVNPSILQSKLLLSITYRIDVHFGVYEGDGICSDLIFLTDSNPAIRMRKLKTVRQPDRVIRLS